MILVMMINWISKGSHTIDRFFIIFPSKDEISVSRFSIAANIVGLQLRLVRWLSFVMHLLF